MVTLGAFIEFCQFILNVNLFVDELYDAVGSNPGGLP
jgi:hypothetical protein